MTRMPAAATAEPVHSPERADMLTALDRYLSAHRSRPPTLSSWNSYVLGVDTLLTFLAVREMPVAAPPDEAALTAWLRAQGYSEGTVRTRISLCRTVMKALHWAGLLTTLPSPLRFHNVLADKRERLPFTAEETRRLLAAADREQTLMVLLVLEAGIKTTELARLRRDQFMLDSLTPTLRLPHGTGEVAFTLSGDLQRRLMRWQWGMPQLEDVGRLWPSVSVSYFLDRFQALCVKAGIEQPERGLHGLRVTAGARVYQNTGSLRETRQFLRTRDVTSSHTYAHAAQWLAEERALPPKAPRRARSSPHSLASGSLDTVRRL